MPALSEEKQTEDSLPVDLLQISSTPAFSKYTFLVDKSARLLFVYEREGLSFKKIHEFPADIGKNDGNKKKENDHKTPEGIYFLQKKLVPPEIPYSLYGKMAFTTDYPNIFDQLEGKTGHGIWLHSIPDHIPLTRGSRGCVVLRNNDLEKIESLITFKQTPLIIHDKINFVTKSVHIEKQKKLADWLETWRSAWQSKNFEIYIQMYDDRFKAPGFPNLKAWSNHKSRLNTNYEKIDVTLSQPLLLVHKNQIMIRTLQKYTSNKHSDYGIKTIYALETEQGYKIVREEWVRADERGLTSEDQAQSSNEILTLTSHPQDEQEKRYP